MKFRSLSPLFVSLIFVVTSSLLMHDAEAKRLGGGKSIGRSSTSSTTAAQKQAAPQNANTPAATQQPTSNIQAAPKSPATSMPAAPAKKPWGGILGGLAMGLGLAALFSAFGMSGEFAQMMGSMLMIALLVGAVLFIWRMWRSRSGGAAGSLAAAGGAPLPRTRSDEVGYYRHAGAEGISSASFKPTEVSTQVMPRFGAAPEGFDDAAFLNTAKQLYTRMQQAWDSGDVTTIARFATPEMHQALKQQIEARQGADKTDVVTLEAQLLGVEATADDEFMASVEFSGLIREETFGGAAPFREVWNFVRSKSAEQAGWQLAGIEQLNTAAH